MHDPFYSLAIRGLDADVVKIEVDHFTSQPGVVIVGLGDTAVQESRERVRAAIKNSGYRFPRGKIVVNLAPADVKKSGPCFDLPIALGLISLAQGMTFDDLSETLFFGELALDGSLRHVNGILSLMMVAKARRFKRVFLPKVNAAEAALIPDLQVYGIESLREVVEYFQGAIRLSPALPVSLQEHFSKPSEFLVDFADVKGQPFVKRALEIAAAGSHNILMNGSPGSGKTMMARALQGILPRMNLQESLEVTRLYSLSGLLPEGEFLLQNRPFRTVHHTASGAALVGGGRVPKPGEISLAHRGVLFMDEMAEFPSHVLELLRQPLEDRRITISRTQGSLTYPAQFLLCAALNPCPCGYYQVPKAKKLCECRPAAISRYRRKLSGPLLDRIDLYCTVSPVDVADLGRDTPVVRSETILARVQKSREIQQQRFESLELSANSEMTPDLIHQFCQIPFETRDILERAVEKLHLTARAYHRVLKVSRTIADLEGVKNIRSQDVLEALQYRRVEG